MFPDCPNSHSKSPSPSSPEPESHFPSLLCNRDNRVILFWPMRAFGLREHGRRLEVSSLKNIVASKNILHVLHSGVPIQIPKTKSAS